MHWAPLLYFALSIWKYNFGGKVPAFPQIFKACAHSLLGEGWCCEKGGILHRPQTINSNSKPMYHWMVNLVWTSSSQNPEKQCITFFLFLSEYFTCKLLTCWAYYFLLKKIYIWICRKVLIKKFMLSCDILTFCC